jgi:hypothetical protein
MVRGVLMKICEAQKKLQHALTVSRIRLGRAFLKIRYDRKGVREQSFDKLGVQRVAFAESLHDPIGANEGLVKKMIEAHLFASQAGRYEIGTRRTATNTGAGGIHNGLLPLLVNLRAKESNTSGGAAK